MVFVTGALPGERVLARLTEEKADFARAALVEVLAARRGPAAAAVPVREPPAAAAVAGSTSPSTSRCG